MVCTEGQRSILVLRDSLRVAASPLGIPTYYQHMSLDVSLLASTPAAPPVRKAEGRGAQRSSLRLATLNIGGPSEARADRLVTFITELDADVLVLTETRANRGTHSLVLALRQMGYRVLFPCEMAAGERGVAVAQRGHAAVEVALGSTDLPHRLVALELQLPNAVTLVGAYVPSRDASDVKIARKKGFLQQMGEAVRVAAEQRQLILLGDLNIIGRDHTPRYAAFRSWEYDALDGLLACGLMDPFAERNPGCQAHSWIGRKGAGYRYDYALVSRELAAATTGCEYLHAPREQGVSDHAAVLLTLDLVAAAKPGSTLRAAG